MRILSGRGTAIALSICLSTSGATLYGSIIVTDSIDAYEWIALDSGLELHSDDLTKYNGFASSFSGGEGNWAWHLSSDGGVIGNKSWIRSAAAGSPLVLTFDSNEVYSVGGHFHLLSTEGFPIDGLIQLELSDGTTYISTLEGEGVFAGFISTDLYIESLSVIGFGTSAPEVSAISNLIIGAIPAPGGIFAIGLVGSVARRRRR